MKEFLAIIMSLFIVLSICGCNESNESASAIDDDSYAIVTFEDGTTEELEGGGPPSLIHENVTAYNQKYAGCRVEVVTTVTNIQSGYNTPGGHMVDLAHGWNIYLFNDDPVLLDLRNGTKLKIVGELSKDSWTIGNPTVTIIE